MHLRQSILNFLRTSEEDELNQFKSQDLEFESLKIDDLEDDEDGFFAKSGEQIRKPRNLNEVVKEVKKKVASTDPKELLVEDTIATRNTFLKYMMIRNSQGFLMIVNLLLSQICFEYINIDAAYESWTMVLVSVTVSFFQLIIVLLYLGSIQLYGMLLKSRLILEDDANVFKHYGYTKLVIISLLLTIHPIIFSFNVPVNFITERYYDTNYSYEEFHRNLVDYFVLFQFIINYIILIIIFLENSKYLDNRSNRIAQIFGIDTNFFYCLKALMAQYHIMFTIGCIVGGVFFFTIVFRITETFYINHLPSTDPTAPKTIDVFFTYFNSLWYCVVTMTTVGFGDLWVRCQLSRIFVYLAGLFGITNSSLFVISFTAYFSMNTLEDNCFTLVKRIDFGEKMKHYAALAVANMWLSYRAKKSGHKWESSSHFKKTEKYLMKFEDMKNNHKNTLSDNSKYEFLSYAAEKILIKLQGTREKILRHYNLKRDYDPSKQAEEGHQSNISHSKIKRQNQLADLLPKEFQKIGRKSQIEDLE